MGDYSLCQGYLSGISGYGSGTTGSTYPRQAISSLTSTTTWGTGIAWDSVNLRVNITTSTYYVLVYASCHILSGTASTTVGLAVYKNGVQISTGSLGQYLGGTTAQPFPIHITWAGSVVNTDNIQIYLITLAGTPNLTSVSDMALIVQSYGGSGLTLATSLNSCNRQYYLLELTSDSATTLSTTEVSVLQYLTGSQSGAPDALSYSAGVINLLKPGYYNITVCLQFKSLSASAQAITIRLKFGGTTTITRQSQLPSALNSYQGGSIFYTYYLSTGTQTVDVTVVSSLLNGYLVASGSTVLVKLARRV